MAETWDELLTASRAVFDVPLSERGPWCDDVVVATFELWRQHGATASIRSLTSAKQRLAKARQG